MTKIKILNKENIEELIDIKMAIEAVESAYVQKSAGKGKVWPLVFYEYEHNVFDLDIRSGNLVKDNLYGLKLISYNENNPQNNLPKIYATALIFDSNTGTPLALLNAEPITAYRTGAAAGIGAKYLARNDSKILLVLGCGNIVPYSIAATLFSVPSIEHVYISNPKNMAHAYEKIENIKLQVKKLLAKVNYDFDGTFEVADNLEETVKMSDIIITATPAEKPMIKSEWVKEGTHFSCMGAGMPNKQEIDAKIFKHAKSYADDIEQCLKVGEVQTAYKEHLISTFNGEIGEIISKEKKGRTSLKDITIFDSTGLFLQDLATSIKLLDKAKQENIGITIEI